MSEMADLIAAIPRCASCGRRRMCPCLLIEQGRIDEFHEWWKEETNPPERFLLGEFGDDGSVVVELVLNPKTGASRYVERGDGGERTVEEEMRLQIPRVTLVKPKRMTAKREVVAQAADAVALKERPESADEFKLTSPTEKDLKKARRRR